MSVEVDECAISAGELGDGGVDAVMVPTSEGRINPCEIEGVIAERRIVHVAKEHGTYRQVAEESVERCGEPIDPRTTIDDQTAQQIVTANRQNRDSSLGRGHVLGLRRKGGDGRAVDRPVLETGWTIRGEVLTLKLREELVVITNEELTRVDTQVVVPPGVED
jgi:hypothetical protein